ARSAGPAPAGPFFWFDPRSRPSLKSFVRRSSTLALRHLSRMLPSDFHPVIQRWWQTRFTEADSGVLPPTEAQLDGWRAIRRGENTLIAAPTGSGKTLAAFLT